MTGDLLSSATEALRTSSGESQGDGGAQTFARVLHTVRRHRRRQRLVRAVIIQVAFLMVAAGAWAISGGRLPAMLKRPWRAPATGQVAPARTLPPPGPRAPLVVPLLREPVGQPPAPPEPVAAASSPREVNAGRQVGAATADDVYRQAHRAHFTRGDFAAALPLWDRYLAATPLPRFAVEARYNRAIALLRLGRSSQAADALRPFADGDYGSYRRSEAQRLLETMTIR